MTVISVLSTNGGVGKTTVAVNLARALASQKIPVVVIDLNPQNLLKVHFGVAPNDVEGLARESLKQLSWKSVIREHASGVKFIPFGLISEVDRLAFEALLWNDSQWLRRQLQLLELPTSTIVIVDSPVTSSVLAKQVLRVSPFVLSVIKADAASYVGVQLFESMIQQARAMKIPLQKLYYLMNDIDLSFQLIRDTKEALRKGLGERLAPVLIHADVAVMEALANQKTVLDYDQYSQASAEFEDLARWVMSSFIIN